MTVGVFADLDGDIMNDAWEAANGLDPTIDDSEGDLEGDTYSNATESVCGTLPNDPASLPAPPVADAGEDQEVDANGTVQLRVPMRMIPAEKNPAFPGPRPAEHREVSPTRKPPKQPLLPARIPSPEIRRPSRSPLKTARESIWKIHC